MHAVVEGGPQSLIPNPRGQVHGQRIQTASIASVVARQPRWSLSRDAGSPRTRVAQATESDDRPMAKTTRYSFVRNGRPELGQSEYHPG